MTNHNEVQNVPSDAEIIAWASEEQFFLFCDHDELLDIVRGTIAKYAAPLAPLTVSLSPDPRGVHVAVHQGSECVHVEAMEVPGAVALPDARAQMVKNGWEIMPDGKIKPPPGFTAIAQAETASDDGYVVDLAIALEQQRALKIVEHVRNQGFAKSDTELPTQAEAIFDLACEEIEHRLRTEKWELCGILGSLPDAASPTPPAGEGQEPFNGKKRVFAFDGSKWMLRADLSEMPLTLHAGDIWELYTHPAPQAAQPAQDELIPCPFCGGSAKMHDRFNSNTVTCTGCGAKVKQSEMGQGDADERWNRRAAVSTPPVDAASIRDTALEDAAQACASTIMMNVDSFDGATAHNCADRIRRLKSGAIAAMGGEHGSV